MPWRMPQDGRTFQELVIEELLCRIDALLEEACALPDSEACWERRLYIDWELIQLFRKIAGLSAGPLPYWSGSEMGSSSCKDAEKAP